MKRFLSVLSIALLLVSCGDDDGLDFEVVPPLLLSDVILEDDQEIVEYLQTHFYNYDEFANPPADFDFRIVIDTIAGDNADRIPLFDQVTQQVINVSAIAFNIADGEEDIPHTLYSLIAREGVGQSPTIADSTFVRIEGLNLQGDAFQAFNEQPIWFDLTTTVRGFTVGTSNLSSGGAISENGDGTFEVEDFGVGLFIMPSGLAFFNVANTNLPIYSPAVFSIQLLTSVIDTDHDNDGVPSIQEDIDGNGLVVDDNTDSDIENFGFIPNFLDPDDDNDGILTNDEITINSDGTITFPDSDGDGTPDYLDNDTN